MSSSELQYIVELSGQQLLPVPGTNGHGPISKHLQFLRDKAHAWFKFNTHSFETVSLPEADGMHPVDMFLTDGHIRLWDEDENWAAIVPILPKPSQQKFERHWSPGTLCSVPGSIICNVYMDPAQNLFAIVYAVSGGPLPWDTIFYIYLGALNSDCIHPRAAGRTLVLPRLPGWNLIAKLKGFERHIALLRCVVAAPGTSSNNMWQLQIWDWQHSTASNLYSIEDMSQTPQLLHSSEPDMGAMYTSDPKRRLLCITNSMTSPHRLFIISTKIFFDLGGTAAATPIPWKCWGPSNTRIFEHMDEFKVGVRGNRVLQAFPVNEPDSVHREFILHLMDFSPLAVTNRRGLGRVVKESSTIDIEESGESVTTSLPYVEVVLDGKFGSDLFQLEEIWIDRDRVYLLNAKWERDNIIPQSSWLEVIDV
ncbi:hypothetical protein DEU56DRAFT_903683, partial [Suillus clintonianus]|uniref:uncharacterized protein n=1 Tax=Suillus clintonianus TaxID=1904413 RepID=UPI001B882805